jgi:hypothetical protein
MKATVKDSSNYGKLTGPGPREPADVDSPE